MATMRRADRVRSGLALVALAGTLVGLVGVARGDDEKSVLERVEDAKLEWCLDLAEVGDREYDQQVLDACLNDAHPQTWDARE
jgi:hypothetical protein